jgi:hypothetical protein
MFGEDYDQIKQLIQDATRNIGVVSVQCLTYHPTWEFVKWPQTLSVRPMIGEEIYSTSHKDIIAEIVNIIHTEDGLVLELNSLDD